jgi:16S rRNA processing protein RimM
MSARNTRQPDELTSSNEPAGSLGKSEPAFLVAGKLRRSHGVLGEMVMVVMTDFPERLRKGKTVYVGDQHQEVSIRSKRNHVEGMLIAFEGYETPESVAILRNEWVYVRTRGLPVLAKGEYYRHQIIGLKVVSDDGRIIGKIEDILETGTHDILLTRSETGSEVLIPSIAPFVMEIDLDKGIVLVHMIPGLEPET